MTYDDIIDWYEVRYGVDWSDFDTDAEAMVWMKESVLNDNKGRELKYNLTHGFDDSKEYDDGIGDNIGIKAVKELKDFESQIDQATTVSGVQGIETKRVVNESKLKKLKDKRIKELGKEQREQDKIEEEQEMLEAKQQRNFDDIINEINSLETIEVTDEEAEFRPILKQIGKIETIKGEINSFPLSDEQKETLNDLIDKKESELQ